MGITHRHGIYLRCARCLADQPYNFLGYYLHKRFDQKFLPKLMKWVNTLETLNEKNIKKELRGMLKEYTPNKP